MERIVLHHAIQIVEVIVIDLMAGASLVVIWDGKEHPVRKVTFLFQFISIYALSLYTCM